jgi:hypothetical protein
MYADTSVFGGVFDEEFSRPSLALFDWVRRRRLTLVTSALVEEELVPAPERVRRLFEEMLAFSEWVTISQDVLDLRHAYVRAGIVTRRSEADALHVAMATVNHCPVLVSWNCRHIVHFEKIPRYNAVNKLNGFAEIAIHTPHEVVYDED